MCGIVQKIYVAFTLLRAHRAAGIRVNMLKDNTEMCIKEMAFKITRTQFDQSLVFRTQLYAKIFDRTDDYLDQLMQFSKTALHIHCVVPPVHFSFETRTPRLCT